MFMATFFAIATIWKQSNCPSTDEWIKNTWYIYTMKYYSAMRNKESLPFATTSMELKGLMLSQISQTQKDAYYMISLMC